MRGPRTTAAASSIAARAGPSNAPDRREINIRVA
jgi:hypothetical protein